MSFSWGRVVAWIIALAVGGVFGVAGTITHASLWGVVPVGLILALVGCAALLLAIRLLTGDRIAALAAGVGMGVVTYILSGTGPGGSVVMPNDVLSLIWTVALALIIVLVIAWPSGVRSRPRADV
ncbi:DUF6113 family protein [Microbacterium sp. X-17]|uniref:DUF6113 family protein n=1 Tax=Microbacterium sp. X-17 TaxID=3144404 RepID=UPI0031F58B50